MVVKPKVSFETDASCPMTSMNGRHNVKPQRFGVDLQFDLLMEECRHMGDFSSKKQEAPGGQKTGPK